MLSMKLNTFAPSIIVLGSISFFSNPVLATTPLAQGKIINQLSVGSGKTVTYMLKVPVSAQNLTVSIAGGSGDADLYVRHGKKPSAYRYDCRPYKNGNKEQCKISKPSAGNYYITLYGFHAANDLSLKADYEMPKPLPVVKNNSPAPNSNNPSNTSCVPNAQEKALLDAHNVARSQARSCGGTAYAVAPPLQWSCKLANAAKVHNLDMTSVNFFSHTGSNGSSPFQRIKNQGYQYRTAGENIAAGYFSVSAVMDTWLKSPGHCSNIMSPSFTELGTSELDNPSATYSKYWTANFGRPQ